VRTLLAACGMAVVRDVVRCGPGHDRAFVSRTDRVSGCEVIRYGEPG
jgi:hypothetical protein